MSHQIRGRKQSMSTLYCSFSIWTLIWDFDFKNLNFPSTVFVTTNYTATQINLKKTRSFFKLVGSPWTCPKNGNRRGISSGIEGRPARQAATLVHQRRCWEGDKKEREWGAATAVTATEAPFVAVRAQLPTDGGGTAEEAVGGGISAQEPEETEGVPTREAGVENADHWETSVRETWVSKKKSSFINNDLVFIKASWCGFGAFFGALQRHKS